MVKSRGRGCPTNVFYYSNFANRKITLILTQVKQILEKRQERTLLAYNGNKLRMLLRLYVIWKWVSHTDFHYVLKLD